MSNFYFFTESDLLIPQTASEAYGAISGGGTTDQYRLCSLHKATSNPKAIAICDGVVCVQKIQDNANLLNIILKPLARPDINMVFIKYIVYKGVLKSSILDEDIILQNTLDLSQSIYDSQQKINELNDERFGLPVGTTQDLPPNITLGYDLDNSILDDEESIDMLFYSKNGEVKLPMVKGGMSIGEFDSNEFGLEIITDGVNSNPTLETVRKIDHILSVNKLAANASQLDTILHWKAKEEILNYMDTVAYFGAFYPSILRAKESNGNSFKAKSQKLYDEILSKYHNNNVCYLDIRNEFNNSFNLFLNYSNNISVAYGTAGSFQSIDYYNQKWPILKLVNANFPSNNTTYKNIIQLSLPKGDNPIPMIFLSQGLWNEGDETDKLPKKIQGGLKFREVGQDSGSTTPFEIIVPNHEISGSTTIIPTYIRIKYFKQFVLSTYPRKNENTTLESNQYLDNIFPIFDINMPFDTAPSGNIYMKVIHEEVYIDDRLDLVKTGVASIGIAFDDANVTFFVYLTDREFDMASAMLNFHTQQINTSSDFLNYLTNLFEERVYWYKSKLEYDSKPDVSYAFYSKVLSQNNIFDKNLDEFMHITISRNEYDTIKSIYDSNTDLNKDFKTYLGLKRLDSDFDKNRRPYKEYELVLRGHKVDNNELKVHEILTSKKLFIYGNV